MKTTRVVPLANGESLELSIEDDQRFYEVVRKKLALHESAIPTDDNLKEFFLEQLQKHVKNDS